MPQDERDVLQVLKSELNFVQKGGYGRSPRDPFRAQLIFEDSPTCMNFDASDHPDPCTECFLIQFVPSDKRSERVPCRHIPLTPGGQTLLELYQSGTQSDMEGALAAWLSETIAQFEAAKPINERTNRIVPTEGASA
jgi:hypothetical protein